MLKSRLLSSLSSHASSRSRQKGSALIAALFIMVLTVITVTALSNDIQMMIQRAHLQTNSQALYLAAEGGVYWGKSFLIRELPLATGDSLGFIPPFPQTLTQKTSEQIEIQAQLENAESRFNLNNLMPEHQNKTQLISMQKLFAQLLQILIPTINNEKAFTVAQNISQWLGKQENSNGIILPELAFEASQLSAEEWKILKPYIIALPDTHTLININTAAAPLIQAVTGLNATQTQTFLALRKQLKSFHDLAQLNSYPNLAGLNLSTDNITLLGQFYLITITSKRENQSIIIQALLQREIKKNKPYSKLWWQVLNPLLNGL